MQLRMFGFHALEFDGDFLVRDDILAEIDIAERAGADLSAESKASTHPQLHQPQRGTSMNRS